MDPSDAHDMYIRLPFTFPVQMLTELIDASTGVDGTATPRPATRLRPRSGVRDQPGAGSSLAMVRGGCDGVGVAVWVVPEDGGLVALPWRSWEPKYSISGLSRAH
jgi:hypothetical protein